MENRERELRQSLVDFGNKLVAEGLVQGTWGNLSVRLDDTHMLVTPSGLDYTRLTADDMVKVNFQTMEYEGKNKPTSEKGLHGEIYVNRSDVNSVIHTHSKYCCIYAAANRNMPINSHEGRRVFGKSIRLAKYALPGTTKLKKNTIIGLGKNMGALMANHGMIVVGKSIEEAFDNCVLLENCGKTNINSIFK